MSLVADHQQELAIQDKLAQVRLSKELEHWVDDWLGRTVQAGIGSAGGTEAIATVSQS